MPNFDLTPPMKWPPFYIHDYFDAKGTIERSVQEKKLCEFHGPSTKPLKPLNSINKIPSSL